MSVFLGENIVCKFGGSSFTLHNFDKISKIVKGRDARKYVVVSAMGKNYIGDTKTTDILLSVAKRRPDSTTLRESEEYKLVFLRHKKLIEKYDVKLDCRQLFYEAFFETYSNEVDFIVSRGEYLSARITASCLGFTFLDAKDTVAFDDGNLDVERSIFNLKSAINGQNNYVMGGFYGGDGEGKVRLMARGGGDISGALFAAAVNASVYENYIDVDGLLSANPAYVTNPQKVECIGYAQLSSLNALGTDVLLSQSIEPCSKHSIPVLIRSIYNPHSQGTLVSERESCGGFIALSVHKVYLTDKHDLLPDQTVLSFVQGNKKLYLSLCAIGKECFLTKILYGGVCEGARLIKALAIIKQTPVFLALHRDEALIVTNDNIASPLYALLTN